MIVDLILKFAKENTLQHTASNRRGVARDRQPVQRS